MIADVFNLGVAAQAGFLAISQHFVEKTRVLLLLGGGVNQTWVCRRIFRLKILDRFKVGRIGHDFGELFQLLELIKLRLFLFRDRSAHKESSVWLGSKTYAPIKRSTIEKLFRFHVLPRSRATRATARVIAATKKS